MLVCVLYEFIIIVGYSKHFSNLRSQEYLSSARIHLNISRFCKILFVVDLMQSVCSSSDCFFVVGHSLFT